VGDKIAEGDILAEIETDKATMEFESFNEGTLYIGIEEGGSAPVDSLLAIIGPEGTDISGIAKLLKLKVLKKTRLLQLKSLNQHQLKNRNQLLRHQLMANVF
jgi:pyruvate/2-oxoglutarate dehydrogenase complex dihydrolipoamide acyltransferase (E2) component